MINKAYRRLREAIELAGGVAGITILVKDLMSFASVAKPIVQVVGSNIAPVATQMAERRKQRSEKGPIDEINFAKTKLSLDGDQDNDIRPLKRNLDSFLAYLENKDADLRVVFVDFYGREIEDDKLRFDLLKDIALIDDTNGVGDSDEANKLRFNQLFNEGILRMPQSDIAKLWNKNPQIKLKWNAFRTAFKTNAVNIGDKVVIMAKEFNTELDIQARDINRELDQSTALTKLETTLNKTNRATRTRWQRVRDSFRHRPLFPTE